MRLAIILQTVVFTSSFIALPVLGASNDIQVKLNSLEKVQKQEKGEDELYISVTEFPTDEAPLHYQIPTYPSHWISKYLPNVKNVVLWQKTLDHCEPINLLISLVEQDLPPWDFDDLLGSVELKITCVNGKPQEQWIIPNPANTAKMPSNQNGFSFTGEKANYRAIFQLEQQSNQQKAK